MSIFRGSGSGIPTAARDAIQVYIDAAEAAVAAAEAAQAAAELAETNAEAVVLDAVAKAGDTMTGVLTMPVGSYSTPSITFTGDTDTGIFRSAGNSIGFTSGGVTALSLNYSIASYTPEIAAPLFSDHGGNLGNSGASKNVSWTVRTQVLTLTDTCTLTFTAPTNANTSLVLVLTQDGTGGRTVTWPGSVLWAGGTPPTLGSAAGAKSLISLFYDGTNYFGSGAAFA